MIIRSRAPVRVSFGGGATDVDPYPQLYGGCVLSTTINKYVWGTLTFRKDKQVVLHSADHNKTESIPSIRSLRVGGKLDLMKASVYDMGVRNGIDLFLRSDFQTQSGLGGSAATIVAIIGLFNHISRRRKKTKYELAEDAYRIETEILKNKTGHQDQYAAVFGGFNFIKFNGASIQVSRINVKTDHLRELEKNLVLVYIGKRKRPGGEIVARQRKAIIEKDKKVVESLHRMTEITEEMMFALQKGDLNSFGKMFGAQWELKKRLNPNISNKYIDALYNVAKRNGAIGGKLSGAGGGGHMILYCKPNTEHIVMKAMERRGAQIVPFSFESQGLQTWEAKN